MTGFLSEANTDFLPPPSAPATLVVVSGCRYGLVSSILMGVPARINRSSGKNHYRLTVVSLFLRQELPGNDRDTYLVQQAHHHSPFRTEVGESQADTRLKSQQIFDDPRISEQSLKFILV
jgi:hypothetical protein